VGRWQRVQRKLVKEWEYETCGGSIHLCLPCIAIGSSGGPIRGGAGTAEDPYQIATAEQLISIGSDPNLLDKHFILTADIDLDPHLPGGRVFDKAVIAPDTVVDGSYGRGGPVFTGHAFAGFFNGGGRRIWHLKILGTDYVGLFGMLASGAEIVDLGVVDVNIGGSGYHIGGLVGESRGTVTRCYSVGQVSGHSCVGGLVGGPGASRATFLQGVVSDCVWDTETSGQTDSTGGTGKTTAKMQTASTFLEAGWDFVNETANGTEDIWWIDEGRDYPRLWWEGDGTSP
jgi:hypothetical protein